MALVYIIIVKHIENNGHISIRYGNETSANIAILVVGGILYY